MDLEFCTVVQNLGMVIEDTYGDSDRNPDYRDITGDVTFTPVVTVGQSYKVSDESGRRKTVVLGRIRARIVDGMIWHEGSEGISLYAGGENSNPDKVVYRVEYSNLMVNRESVTLNGLSFEAAPGETIDLTDVTPVAGVTPAGIVKGDPFTYEDFTPEQLEDLKSDLYDGITIPTTAELTAIRDHALEQISETRDEALNEAYAAIESAKDANTVPRVTALEAMNGVSPESPVDGQTANLLAQPHTLTRQVLDRDFTQAPIDLSGRGVSHQNTAAENTPIILDAITEASGTGRQILFPYCPPNAWIDVDQELVIPGGMSVMGHGQGRTRIRQLKRMSPLFDVIAPDVEVRGFTGKQTTENPTSAEKGFFRGEPGTGRLAVVRVQADRVHVADVTGIDANAVVHFAAWDVPTNARRPQLTQCRAINIHSIDCVFGLLAVGVEDFYFDNVTGNYLLRTGWGTPPHLLYFSEGLGDNIDIRGGTAYAKNGMNGQAFQFKGVKGGNVVSLRARDCAGLLNLILNEDLEIDTLISMGDNSTSDLYGSLILQGVNKRVTIRDVTIQMAATGKPLRTIGESEDIKISRLNVVSNHTSESSQGGLSYDVDIDGTRVEINDVTVRNVGPVAWGSSIGIFGGTDNRIVRPVTSGNNFGVTVRGSASGSVIEDYDIRELQGVRRAFDMAANAALSPRRHIDTPSPDSVPVLMEDGSTPVGTSPALKWPQIGPEWVHNFGSWRSYDGLMRPHQELNVACLLTPIGKPDIRITGDVIYGDRTGFAARVSHRNNCLSARLNHLTGTAQILARKADIETVLAETPLAPIAGQSYQLDFGVVGDRLKLTVNGSIEVEHTLTPEDHALYTSTDHGLICNSTLESGYKNITMY